MIVFNKKKRSKLRFKNFKPSLNNFKTEEAYQKKCCCVDSGAKVMISFIYITLIALAASTGYNIGKNSFLKKKLRQALKHQKIIKNNKTSEVQLNKVVEVVENKYK